MTDKTNNPYTEDSNLSDTFISKNHKKENKNSNIYNLFIYDDITTPPYGEKLFPQKFGSKKNKSHMVYPFPIFSLNPTPLKLIHEKKKLKS